MTNNNEIFKLLNKTKIVTAEYEEKDLSQREKDDLFSALKTQISTQKSEKKTMTPILAFVAAFILLIGSQTSIGQHVQATAYSILENIRYSLSQALGNEDSESEGAIAINQTASIGDAKISIGELVAFDHRMIFNVLIDLDQPSDEQAFAGFSDVVIEVNGEEIDTQGFSGIGEIFDEQQNIMSVVYSTQLNEEILTEEELNISLSFQDIRYYNPTQVDAGRTEPYSPIEGIAQFETTTTLEELSEYTQVYEINEYVTTGEYDYHIEKLYVHPIINYIETSSENWGDETYQLNEIRGTDNQGREVVFEQGTSLHAQNFRRNSFTLNENNSEIPAAELAHVKSLELQFYSAGWPEGGSAHYEAYGEPFTIEFD